MPRVAFATEPARPFGFEDDARMRAPCAALGIEIEPAVWDDPGVDWRRYDAVLLRTVWDYYTRLPEFLAWIEGLPVPVWNPPAVVRWNARKTYLAELGARGVPVVPSALLRPGESIAAVMHAHGWAEAVLKPVVSAGAWRTYRVGALGPAQADLDAADGPMLLQPFLREIQTRGEWSLLYFGGVLSHSLRKLPAAGDFRVQEKHGGHIVVEAPPTEVVAAAGRAIAAMQHDLLYARMDLVETEAGPRLIEAELIEPELFLRLDPVAPARLAAALAARLR